MAIIMKLLKKLTASFLAVIIIVSAFSSASALGFEDKYHIGDVNLDGNVDILDVTYIQKHMARISVLTGDALAKADTDYNTRVDIKDATHIQKILAKLSKRFSPSFIFPLRVKRASISLSTTVMWI